MLDKDNVYKELSRFASEVVYNARTNFLAKDASGKGSKSIGFDLETFKSSFSLTFEMEGYMHYQDKGVSGTETKYNTEFSYKNKKPPASAFDKWTIRRGLAPRDDSGKFKSREGLKYALSNYIFKHGIKPSLFFTKAFEREFRTLPNELVEAYGLDIDNLMKLTLDTK